MRLFIAILFEENIINALTQFQDNLKAKGVKGNYSRRENLHITLIRKAVSADGRAIPVVDAPNWEMRVARISLMKSERGKNGMVYTEL